MTKRPAESALDKKIADLAEKIADEAIKAPLAEQVDAFKALTTYHVNTTKINAKLAPDDEEDISFDQLRKRVSASSGGA